MPYILHSFAYVRRFLAAGLLFSLAAACASAPPKTDLEAYAQWQRNNDPLEPLNRQIFSFNTAIDKAVIRPVVIGYKNHVPAPVRRSVSNVVDNANGPYILLNDILQGKPRRAGVTLSRFLINTTIGLAGIFDPAGKWGLERHDEDIGQTLAVWGVPEGPYLVLPLFGPSNIRDTAGLVGEVFADPVSIVVDETNFAQIGGSDLSYFTVSRTVLGAFNYRVEVHEAVEDIYGAPDPYVRGRSWYRQFRIFEITDGTVEGTEEEEELFEDPGGEF